MYTNLPKPQYKQNSVNCKFFKNIFKAAQRLKYTKTVMLFIPGFHLLAKVNILDVFL